VYRGFIDVPREGIYKFNFIYTGGKKHPHDYCAVKIGGHTVLCTHKDSAHTVTDPVALEAGLHEITIVYKTYGYRRIDFYWQGPGIKEQKAPSDIFFHLVRS
jgi:hypothetical protein